MFSAYLASITDRAQTTQRAARRVCHDFDRWRQGRTIDLALLDAYRAKLHRSHKAASSCNTDMSHLSTALRFLIRRKLVELYGDPGEVLKPFKVDRPVPMVLSPDELRRLWAVDMPGHQTVKALIVTAARAKEAEALTPASARAEGLIIQATKTSRARRIPWSLLSWTRYLFEDLPLPKLDYDSWNAIRKAAGLEYPLKALRSTTASYIASAGKLSPLKVARMCGHRVTTADQYYWDDLDGVEGDDVPSWLGLANNPVEPGTLDNESNLVVG
jgi:hypothetical protein